jgi:hypothetical protein
MVSKPVYLGKNTLNAMNKIILIVACILYGCISSFAQATTAPSQERIYFEFTTLDFNKYVELHETIKADGNYIIETACIPAKVICVKKLNATSSSGGFKQLATLTGLTATEWLQGQQTNAFDQRCLDARTGN